MRQLISFCFFAVLMLVTDAVNAQLAPPLTQYWQAQHYYNPAFAGSTGGMRLSGVIRNELVQVNGPVFSLVSGDLAVGAISGGIGANIYYLGTGNERDLGFDVSYAYQLGVGPGAFAIGGSIGANHKRIALNVVSGGTLGNQLVSEGQLLPLFSVGTAYYTDRFFLGYAAKNLFEPTYDELVNANQTFTLNSLMGGVSFAGDVVDVEPSAHYQFVLGDGGIAYEAFDLNLQLVYNRKFWGGLLYRSGGSFGVNGAIAFDVYKVGYGYNRTSDATGIILGSHEIFFTMLLGGE